MCAEVIQTGLVIPHILIGETHGIASVVFDRFVGIRQPQIEVIRPVIDAVRNRDILADGSGRTIRLPSARVNG